MITRFAHQNSKYFYFAFRVLVGFMFLSHGAQKLFGAFGGKQVELMSKFGAAGAIEFFGGLLILVGLFTHWAALISGLEILYAYIVAHAPKGILPIANSGELALLYFASFLIIFAYGAGIWAIDNKLKKRIRKK